MWPWHNNNDGDLPHKFSFMHTKGEQGRKRNLIRADWKVRHVVHRNFCFQLKHHPPPQQAKQIQIKPNYSVTCICRTEHRHEIKFGWKPHHRPGAITVWVRQKTFCHHTTQALIPPHHHCMQLPVSPTLVKPIPPTYLKFDLRCGQKRKGGDKKL